MNVTNTAAIVAAILLGLLLCFQVLLAVGMPLGKAAWGGEYRVLPANLRWASVAAVFVLALAAWMILARAGIMAPGANTKVVRILTWCFGGYFTLNVVMNLLSNSTLERMIMTPTAVILVACFFMVSRS